MTDGSSTVRTSTTRIIGALLTGRSPKTGQPVSRTPYQARPRSDAA